MMTDKRSVLYAHLSVPGSVEIECSSTSFHVRRGKYRLRRCSQNLRDLRGHVKVGKKLQLRGERVTFVMIM